MAKKYYNVEMAVVDASGNINVIYPTTTSNNVAVGSNETLADRLTTINSNLTNKADKSETTVNLLNPTLQSTTRNGVSVINNTDGTYSFKGTATDNIEFQIAILTLKPGQYKYFGSRAYVRKTDMTWVKTVATGNIVSITEDNPVLESVVYLNKGDSIDKTIPFMITANLYATTDDFVPYTGDSGSLNGDVANIVSRLNNIYFEGTATFTKNNVPQNVIPIQSEGLYFITGTTNRSSRMVSAALWYAVKVPSGYGTIKIAETNYEYELSNTVMNYITVRSTSSTTATESNPLIVNIKVIKLA